MKEILFSIFLMVFSQNELLAQKSEYSISADFPGGNIVVEKIENDTVWLKPDLRDTKGNWFYWYFKVSGIAGKNIRFQFLQTPVFARYGPAYSINNDDNWKWYGESSWLNNGFTYRFRNNDTCAYFCVAFPYTQKNLHDFFKKMKPVSTQSLKLDTLCFSRKQRAVEQIHLLPKKKTAHKILMTARNHACEMMANYVLEGVIQSVLNEKDLQYLRDNVELCLIPFMDKDGVEDGDQGKSRKPHDHNRDYNKNPIYPEVRSIMEKVTQWSENKLKIVMDLHCPYIIGNGDPEYLCFIGEKHKNNEQQQIILSDFVGNHVKDELQFYKNNFLKYGEFWNTDANYTQGITCSEWGSGIPGIACSTTLEFPYANVSGTAVSKDNARAFGRAIAFGMQDYLISLVNNTSQSH